MSEVLLRCEAGVAILTLNRPEARNALNLPTRKRLAEHVAALDKDESVRVIVIMGDRKAFAAGADVALLADKSSRDVADLGLPAYWSPIECCSKPLVACVEGLALGAGFELALMCDFIVASESAKFGLPEVRLGIMPGAGGTQRLMRLIGRQQTLRLVLTGDLITAERAFQLGIVSDLLSPEDCSARALEIAASLAAHPRIAVSHIREAVRHGADLSLASALALERGLFQLLFDTADQKEGMAAFLEKRPSRFTGG